MQLKLSHAGRPVSDYLLLVDMYGDAELSSPLRSTVPLLAYWQDPVAACQRFGGLLGIPASSAAHLPFEHPVATRRGRGKASFTDLLLTSNGTAIAVEAKSSEPPYQTVGEWLGASPSPNRKDVIDGWLDLIANAVGRRLRREDVESCSYQLIHRTASVCSVDAGRRLVVYHCFDASERMLAYYREQLSRLRALLGDRPGLEFWLVRTTLGRSAQYSSLVAAWKSTPAEKRDHTNLASNVRIGLLDGSLLSVEKDTPERV